MDPLGLATQMCKRKLSVLPFRLGPLFHQFLCVPDGKGGKVRAGIGPMSAMTPFKSKAKMEFEGSTEDAVCEEVADDNACIEQCIAEEFRKPLPLYSIDLSKGENCQSWSNATFANCHAQCRARR